MAFGGRRAPSAAALWLAPLAVVAVQAVAQAEDLRFDGRFEQGALIIGHAPPGSRVTVEGRSVRVDPEGRFAFGFGRDHGAEAHLTVTPPGGASQTVVKAVAPVSWVVQRIDGLPDKAVNPDAKALARIKAEQVLINKARGTDRAASDWAAGFSWPAKGRISGVFGSQRVLNGQARSPHAGLDVAVPTGTAVHPVAPGVVTLAEPDLYFTGGTVIVDHGAGVFSLYAHLSRLDVKAGDVVRSDSVIAQSGMTGRATGPHLHFGLYWFGTPLNPASVLGGQ